MGAASPIHPGTENCSRPRRSHLATFVPGEPRLFSCCDLMADASKHSMETAFSCVCCEIANKQLHKMAPE